jgi:hypothetical protein
LVLSLERPPELPHRGERPGLDCPDRDPELVGDPGLLARGVERLRIGGGTAVVITVCVGSSCHVRGSHEILQRFTDLIAEHRLKEQVSLRGSFCMERCTEGVNMDIDGEPLSAQTLQEAERIFQEKVLARVSPRSHGVHGENN